MLWLSIASIFFTAAHVHLVLGHVLTYGRGHFVRQKDNDTRDPDDPLLTNYPGQGSLPTLAEIIKLNSTNGTFLKLDNIQGDILIGMKKPLELFFFFQINDTKKFKVVLKEDIHPLVTTTTQLVSPAAQQPLTLLNIAFSQSGLKKLNVLDNINDPAYTAGQDADAKPLGDPGITNWVQGFTGTETHGVFLIASDKDAYITAQLQQLLAWLGPSITERHRLMGAARPGAQAGHEHFGFLDGISQPAVAGFATSVLPGQSLILPGTILLNEPGDTSSRPTWATDGSFLAFRQLQQFVPEFNKYLLENPVNDALGTLTPTQGSELLGARMIGRWKSGAPLDLAPVDNPTLGADPTQNNNFDFSQSGFSLVDDQSHCPFSAHIRKTRPRADEANLNIINQIIRAGIPYGPELSQNEVVSNKTASERGLAFVSYQSDLSAGFRFQQIQWANSPGFPGGKVDSTPGFDPIIGQNQGGGRFVSGLDPANPNHDFALLFEFVQSRGGEYFFSPSLSALLNPISV